MGRGLIAALLVSLAINVFAVGFIAGRVLTPHHPPPPMTMDAPRQPTSPFNVMRHAQILPEARQQAFRQALKAQLPNVREQQREIRVLRRAYFAALTNEAWDRAAVERASEELHAAREKARLSLNKAFYDAMETLEPEERQLLLKQVSRDRRQKGKKWRDRPPKEKQRP